MKKRLLLSALTLSMACPKPAPKKPEPKKNSEAQSTSTQAAPNINPSTVAASMPAPKKPSGTIFFVNAGRDNFVSLACFDTETKALAEEDDCVAWLPKEKDVRSESGEPGALAPIPQPCTSGKAFSGATGSFALFPLESTTKLSLPESIDLKKLSSAEKKSIDKEVKAHTKSKHEIVFAASLDLNNDGRNDRLYGVAAKSFGTDAAFDFSGVFFADAKKPSVMVLLLSSPNEKFSLRGGIDLDQDNILELWIEKILIEENIEVSRQFSLEKVVGGVLEEISSREVCL